MVKIKIGNILDAEEDIIVHQVNVFGSMGGGLARQLANQYPGLEEEYRKCCSNYNNNYEKLKGIVLFIDYKEKLIANVFSQKTNFDTDYNSLITCLEKIKGCAISKSKTVCMPYKIGCGIANGDWNIVYKIIEEVFNDYDVTLYRLENKNEQI